MAKQRIFLVGKERVAIIKANEHTYNVRFLKRGIFMEVKKCYVKTWIPPSKPPSKSSATSTQKSKKSQTRLDL